MPKAVELLQQGRSEELWQMCCGFLKLDLKQFMAIQKRLLLEEIELLHRSQLGRKIMQGTKPESVEEFRKLVPLSFYNSYCPELIEKREDVLPVKPAAWVHTSGRSGEYPCKWVPITPAYQHEMSQILYGVGMLASSKGWGDVSSLSGCPRVVYTVAPRPYMSGTMASMLELQSPAAFMPPLDEAEGLPFEERIRLGFQQALYYGVDHFFGLSLVLVAVGNRFAGSSGKVDIRPLLAHPRALLRLSKGLIKARLARRRLLPRDIWNIKGIMSGGLDSGVYREKIKELWGRYPLDVYASTEGAIVATQTWDYDSMSFIPNLNFLEFIPEKEHFKWQIDHSYQPQTVLLDEVEPGQSYEIVLTNFHGGALVRYRVGDMIKITALRNEKLGINTPQMVFERRADDLLDFVVVRLTEKTTWQAIENSRIPYEDWTVYKEPEEPVLNLLIELKDGYRASEQEVAAKIHEQVMKADNDDYSRSQAHNDLADMVNFKVKVTLLPRGAFANFTARRRAEGADLAHLKPPHINPSEKVLSLLLARPERPRAVVPVSKTGAVTVK